MKIQSFFALIIFVALSLIPPINFIIHNPPLEYWLWMVIIAGFFGVFTLFLNTHWVLKATALSVFVNCFFSSIPYLSFTSYVMIIACCYFYVLCTKITDWSIIFNALQSVLILNILFLFMQFIGHDPLLNFGMFHMEHYGILGQHMQMSSFIVIISSLLVMVNKWYMLAPLVLSLFCHSSWSFISVGVGIFVYLFSIHKKLAIYVALSFMVLFIIWIIKDHKISENLNKESGRLVVWQRSIELSNKKPWFGWGAGTFKDIFPPISQLKCIPYRNAHNLFIQFLFEFGYPLTICLVVGLGCLIFNIYRLKLWLPLSGICMLLSDSLIHFPDRMIQTVPLIIIFLAYTQFQIRRIANG